MAEYVMPQKEQYGPGLLASSLHLTAHLHEVPVHIIPCIAGRAEHESPLTCRPAAMGSMPAGPPGR